VSAKRASKVVSIQAKSRKGGAKSPAALRQAETLRHAWNSGNEWSNDEVSQIMNSLEKNESQFDLALSLGRTYYSTGTARTHVRFAIRHIAVLRAAWGK